MRFQERSFVQDHSYRPRPTIHWNKEEGLLIVATPWGQDRAKDTVIKQIEDFIISSKLDQEQTSPFKSMQHYDKTANSIRTAILLANDHIYKTRNKGDLVSGFEIMVGVVKNSQIYFATIGHPHILLSRQNKNILPLFVNLDHALNLSSDKLLPALPDKLLGVSSPIEIQVHNFKYKPGDHLILLSKSWIPEGFLNLTDRKFDSYTQELAKDQQQAFWLGVMEF